MLVDLKPFLDDSVVRRLISYCIFNPVESRIDDVIWKYRENVNLLAKGYLKDGKIVGFIGVDISDMSKCVLTHIAVGIPSRGQAIGKGMLEELVSELDINYLEAETDAEAVEFYRHCGFEVKSLGEKYPGVTRYLCRQFK